MANSKISEGVGKKIVEALKKQSEIEINPIQPEETDDLSSLVEETFNTTELDDSQELHFEDDSLLDSLSPESELNIFEEESFQTEEPQTQPFEESTIETNFETPFSQPAAPAFNYQQPAAPIADNFVSELDNFEIPSNIAVLKKLISQLPSGVTRHTGAQIIRQTMEALGISMKSVLQEAQQVQEGLSNSAKECQASIQEYKKQIINLEKQAQNHQRQYSALNELISLFIQTGR